MNILGLIPARGGSKGVPQKNKRLLGNKPLVVYSIEKALESQVISKVMVSTDDQEIADISIRHGAEVPYLRPDELSADDSPTIDTVIHTLRYFQNHDLHFDAVCLLQPTVPFRSAADIKNAVELFRSRKPDSLVSVREIPKKFNPYWAYEHDESDHLRLVCNSESVITRRQSLPKAYFRDGSIYIVKSDVVLEQHSLYGKSSIAFQCNKSPDINIDTMADWEEAINYAQTL